MGWIQRVTNQGRMVVDLFRLSLREREAAATIARVTRERLSYLGIGALTDLHEAVREVEQAGLEGILIEAGCALGGSALVMGKAKEATRPLHIFDTFGMIPPPGEGDGSDAHERYEKIASGASEGIKDDTYYGYMPDLLARVQENFDRYELPAGPNHVAFFQGLYEERLHVEQPVALAHIDCDWYDSVITCLERIEPQLVRGGILVIDDYWSWSGCRAAVDDFFADRRHEFEFRHRWRLHIVKK